MKNKFSLLALFALLLSSQLFLAQNTLPNTGNVGIGTTTPTNQLEVVGKTKLGKVNITDTLTVQKPVNLKDSLTVDKKLTVKQDVKIIGKTVMTDNVRAKSNLTVLGNTRTKGNEVVEGNTKVLGTTKMMGNGFVEGIFKFKGLADNTTTENRFLMIRPNGKAESLNKSDLLKSMYLESCITKNNTFSPIWANIDGTSAPSLTHGVLYTGLNCPTWVGIGTDNPLAQLHVVGSGYFGGRLNIGVAPSATTTAKLNITQNAPNRHGIVLDMTNSNSPNVTGVGIIALMHNPLRKAMTVVDATGYDVFSVYGDGVVNIKKQQPTAKSFYITDNTNFDVFRVMGDGTVYATEVNVLIKQDFPDYVFSKNYNLMSLPNLETYIKENKHLPNVPSAKEAKENGINVSELLVTQMEKIEELTLYIIELEKRLSELEN